MATELADAIVRLQRALRNAGCRQCPVITVFDAGMARKIEAALCGDNMWLLQARSPYPADNPKRDGEIARYCGVPIVQGYSPPHEVLLPFEPVMMRDV